MSWSAHSSALRLSRRSSGVVGSSREKKSRCPRSAGCSRRPYSRGRTACRCPAFSIAAATDHVRERRVDPAEVEEADRTEHERGGSRDDVDRRRRAVKPDDRRPEALDPGDHGVQCEDRPVLRSNHVELVRDRGCEEPELDQEGTTYRTSRYRTLSAARKSPTPNATTTTYRVNTRARRERRGRGEPVDHHQSEKHSELTTRSMRYDAAAAVGMRRRGKYTFETSGALPTTLFAAPVTAFAKNVQGTRAARVKTGYGTSSGPTPRSWPIKRVKTTMSISGWRTAHDAPSAVCL